MITAHDGIPSRTTALTRVYFKGVGHVRVHQHRGINGRVKTVTAKREGQALVRDPMLQRRSGRAACLRQVRW